MKTSTHGTRTMYQRGCRCDECCKAEHLQYLKRSVGRIRMNSKWGEQVNPITTRGERQKKHNRRRYAEYTATTPYKKRIRWQTLAERDGMKCALCGIETDPNDVWLNENGRKCFGRRYPTVDHIVPLKLGGVDEFDNVQLLCKHCNSAKGKKYNEQAG